MASLTRKILKGRAYYYLRECQRVNGKPTIVRQKYVGSADKVAALLEAKTSGVPATPPRVQGHHFGAVAALFDVASDLGVVDLIDRHAGPSSTQGLTVGTYLLIAAINRCAGACSKSKIAEWFDGTVLPRLLPVESSQLTSQRFWHKMDRLAVESLATIDRELTRVVLQKFDLETSSLFYDATNFFTFIDSFNARSKLAQRGHCKHGRDNLRILGLALLVTRRDQVPLFSHLYPGNQHDAVTFRGVLDEMVARYKTFVKQVDDVTVVFDKGNNAEDIIERLDDSPYHFVGSLVPTQHAELLAIRRAALRPLDPQRLPTVRARRTRKVVFGVERTVLVTFNTVLFNAQLRTLNREVAKRIRKLSALTQRLERWRAGLGRGKAPTRESVQKAADQILKARHMKELIRVRVTCRGKIPRLDYRPDRAGRLNLKRTLLGKTLIFTDRDDWSDEDIVEAYRGQANVEAAFRQMKDPHFVSFRPTFHWTDQKVHVHAFYCVLALLLASLLRKRLADKGIRVSIARMLKKLHEIRESTLLYRGNAGQPRIQHVIDDMDPLQQRIFEALNLEKYAA